MKVSHRKLADLERGYSLSLVPGSEKNGLPAFLAGSEGHDRLLYLEPPDFKPRVIAKDPGGFISHWPLIRGDRRFVVSTTQFYPGFESEEAEIHLYSLDEGEYPKSTFVAKLPFTHRITMLHRNGRDYLLASTLCAAKDSKEDWSQPGGIHLAEVPEDPRQPWPMRQVVSGLNKNHGMDYAVLQPGGREGYLLSAMEGLFFMPIPADPSGDWTTELLSPLEHSDAFAFDWNGNGTSDVFTISPFHGNVLSRFSRLSNSWVQTVIAEDLALGHIVWAGNLLGRPGLLAGSRRENRELRLYRPDPSGPNGLSMEILDDGIGPSQMQVIPLGPRRAVLYLAAHGINEIRIYDLQE